MTFQMFSRKRHPLTPQSPSMPTSMHLVQDPIPPLPMTPPDPEDPSAPSDVDSASIVTAIQVISTERTALAYLERIYQTDKLAQENFARAVSRIATTRSKGAKLIVCGVGKSGKIGEKIVATLISMGIQSAFLHPTEALHGDLGMIMPHDTILFITFSGRTSELLSLLPHIAPSIPIIALTSHIHPSSCPLLAGRNNSILIPAPIHEEEKISFGLSAPTTSTTVALALGDALALAVARKLHTLPGLGPAEVFQSHHPGGAIGAMATPTKMADIATPVSIVPIVTSPSNGLLLRALDVVLAAVRSPGGYVRVGPTHIIAPRRIQTLQRMDECVRDFKDIVIEKTDWISIPADSTVGEVKEWIASMRLEPRGRTFLKEGTILGIVDERREVSGVVEIEDVVGDDWGGGK